jgi:UDP-N-acetylmuramoyl-L-alanyl-D-glutamate--2,6-diaminopimelate ligase
MKLVKKIYWQLKAWLACCLYRFPAKKINIIGVTGTDGKTSTTKLIYHFLYTLGERVDYVSTVGAHVAGHSYHLGFHVTTPRYFALQKYIAQSVSHGGKYFVLEVTSHSIDQRRIWGCHFKVAVLTNITNEHLDYHKNYTNYAKTKLQLINNSEMAVVNRETTSFYRYRKLITNPNIWYTAVSKKADITYSDLLKYGLKRKLVGFEKENVVAAFAAVRVLGFPPEKIAKAINSFSGVKGRFDFVSLGGYQFLIDFAHTPNAFAQLYKALETKKRRRLIHVFGCAGERDRFKRAKMGFLAGQNADLIILTEEDYRTEKLADINKDIERGIRKAGKHQKNKTYFIIDSRFEAIKYAVKLAGKEDLIMLTGKAHEKSLARHRKEYSWDEYEAVSSAVNQK